MTQIQHGYLGSIGLGKFTAALALQFGFAIFLAHGYDFRVNYVAGRNVASGLSPYLGGELSGDLAAGYGPSVQGLGETPLWALYMGVSYILSAGDIFLFNLISKIPIIMANIILSIIAVRRGCDGIFFLLNPFTLLVTASWGKPDNIASLLSMIGLLYGWGGYRSSLALSASLLIKPLALPLLPGHLGFFRIFSKLKALIFLTVLTGTTLVFFLLPFLIFSWPLQTVIEGLPNWLKPAGGISPFNIVEALTGEQILPESLLALGLLAPVSIIILVLLSFLLPPTGPSKALNLALLGAMVFFTLRPWVSEQNLFIILALIIMVNRRLPSRLLWVVPLLFSLANLSLPQNLYLVGLSFFGANVIEELHDVDNEARLWIRLVLSVAWLVILWRTVLKAGMVRWRD